MGKVVNPQMSYSMLDRKRVALLKKMSRVGPFIMATATYLMLKCGNPNCKCAKKKKDRHEKLHISWTDAKGDGTGYVPVNLRQEVFEWIENYWTMKEMTTEMTLLSRKMIKLYAKTHPRAKKQPVKRI